jgi:hypothetical protein
LVGELEGIADHVHKDLLNSLLVGVDDERHLVIDHLSERDALELALLLEEDNDVTEELSDVEVFILERELLIVVELGQVLDVLDHGEDELEAESEVAHVLDHLWLLVANALLNHPAGHLNAVQGSLEVVDNGCQLKQISLLGLLELIEIVLGRDVPDDEADDGSVLDEVHSGSDRDVGLGAHYFVVNLHLVSPLHLLVQVLLSQTNIRQGLEHVDHQELIGNGVPPGFDHAFGGVSELGRVLGLGNVLGGLVDFESVDFLTGQQVFVEIAHLRVVFLALLQTLDLNPIYHSLLLLLSLLSLLLFEVFDGRALVAGQDRRVQLFNLDHHLLHSVRVPHL